MLRPRARASPAVERRRRPAPRRGPVPQRAGRRRRHAAVLPRDRPAIRPCDRALRGSRLAARLRQPRGRDLEPGQGRDRARGRRSGGVPAAGQDAHPERGAAGDTHPETVLRAWALERWANGDGDARSERCSCPGSDIERLDLVDRERLESLTRRLVMDAVAPDWMHSGAVTGHARQFLVDVRPTATWGGQRRPGRIGPVQPPRPSSVRVPAEASPETRRFLAYVLLDLATVDPDLEDEPLVECLAVAREAGHRGRVRGGRPEGAGAQRADMGGPEATIGGPTSRDDRAGPPRHAAADRGGRRSAGRRCRRRRCAGRRPPPSEPAQDPPA